ncbi:conjugal transfer protein [Salmonella enterica subsp. enterica]|nr:conjugal transfer protein [Salmonella enterica subsp. enterica serovar Mikawasima]EDN7229272.1 conjugal transfer protein TraW [Salmonella enterica subsp. enterica serovar Mikawasima]
MRLNYFMAILLGMASPVFAQNVYVTGSRPVDSEIMPALGTTNATLGSILSVNTGIGGAITEGTDKIAAMIQESVTNQQQYASYMQESQNLEHARQSYTVPDSICSDSASGVAAQVSATAAAKQSSVASGSSISDNTIKKVMSDPTPPPEQRTYTTATVHGKYCSSTDESAYGDSICKGASDMPGGDTDISSILTGAGPEGKTPDLTFTQDQVDAATMYMENSASQVVSKKLSKGEVKSDSGKQYVGLMAQYDAIQSAARQPQLELIADSQTNEATKDALAESMEASEDNGTAPSTKSYFDATASAQAKQTGMMSKREYDEFEVGRRYANTDYLTDLSAMEGDNLTRELIKVENLQNWILLGIRQQLQEQSVISGQQLNLSSATYFGPRLQDKLQQVTAGAARK